jgi:hypothetical protein
MATISGTIPITVTEPAPGTVAGVIRITVTPPLMWMRDGSTLVPVYLAKRVGENLILL